MDYIGKGREVTRREGERETERGVQAVCGERGGSGIAGLEFTRIENSPISPRLHLSPSLSRLVSCQFFFINEIQFILISL